uniref:MotA/TolQ/ExbB proton channel family protein n=1 Tax=Thaumasiovibrio occultus TaxID=1891184 RepID=UPI000B361C01|nr:MotA/TolQ/ExbB proton channel family protein [Thaumasiovibrio occultus]
MVDVSLLTAGFGDGWWLRISHFMTQGGQVLWLLAVVVLFMWVLIIERISYLRFTWPASRQGIISQWRARGEFESWYAHAVKSSLLNKAHYQLHFNLNMIKLLVSICPMIGLLGTVTGMISVFDIMSSAGNGDPKLMATGISMATLPTMAGMVAAITGMFVHARLQKACDNREATMEKLLRNQGCA